MQIEINQLPNPAWEAAAASRVPLEKWKSRLGDESSWAAPHLEETGWETVRVPHNWERYEGYRGASHGNRHGTAWYRCRWNWFPENDDERIYAFFEGVGSYATVWCNGQPVGKHAGGRTTFTLDLTGAAHPGSNLLAVRAHHPGKIDDLPFVCGGCWGSPKTEGSQPFGIFRPVWLERSGPVRVAPFGLHLLTPEIDRDSAWIEARVETHNPTRERQTATLQIAIYDPGDHLILSDEADFSLAPGETRIIPRRFPRLASPRLWAPEHPDLYQARVALTRGGRLLHSTQTPFGLRWLQWPAIPAPDAAGCAEEPVHWHLPSRAQEPAPSRTLYRHTSAPLSFAAGGIIVKAAPDSLPERAELTVSLALDAPVSTPVRVFCEVQNGDGTVFFHQHRTCLEAGPQSTHEWTLPPIHDPSLWQPPPGEESQAALYKLVVEIQNEEGDLWERRMVMFGIRPTSEALNLEASSPEAPETGADRSPDDPGEARVLRLNGEPLFLVGTCEYETLLGNDHAFTEEQIAAEVAMIRAAGFNAFRDAHHPHNLRYYHHWDRAGIVCWTQMGSHIWFDNERFRENYRQLVTQWVKERRNHPSIILWGLQNESVLPEAFARELRDLIRELDPSCPGDRLTTTCNGGKGSDWNVPQEWSGTYGGNYNDYRLALHGLVGEFGAWRSFGVHTEREYRGDENDFSESWAVQAMETKIRLGENDRHRAIGHFHWVFNTFPNPGRSPENVEGPGNGAIGSVNNKGLVTAWRQPSDLFYLFRANYADATREPMVYLISHTWPERWRTPGAKVVRVLSNCAEVELFDGSKSLGRRKHPGRGHHFRWEGVELRHGLLTAVGLERGKMVAEDRIAFEGFPQAKLPAGAGIGAPPADPGRVLHRISCGDATGFLDPFGREWSADRAWESGAPWGSSSWAERFPGVAGDLASIGYTLTPVEGTPFPALYRTYRYGRDQLTYRFATGPGRYHLRLHLVEPWFGVGGGCNCKGWRLFDIAVNGSRIEEDLDIWGSAGGDHRALVREYEIDLDTEILTLHFPFVRVNQALICGIELFERALG